MMMMPKQMGRNNLRDNGKLDLHQKYFVNTSQLGLSNYVKIPKISFVLFFLDFLRSPTYQKIPKTLLNVVITTLIHIPLKMLKPI